jgi:hypothetical protein
VGLKARGCTKNAWNCASEDDGERESLENGSPILSQQLLRSWRMAWIDRAFVCDERECSLHIFLLMAIRLSPVHICLANVVRRLIGTTLAQTRSMFDRQIVESGDCKHPRVQT